MTKTATKSIATVESKAVKAVKSSNFASSVQTRILLALWTLGEATKSELKGSLVRKREKETAADYEQRGNLWLAAMSHLDQSGAFVFKENKISLSDKGLELLEQGLLNSEFAFDAQIGAKTANALLRWMQQKAVRASKTSVEVPKQTAGVGIASYEDFKPVVLKAFEKLDKEFNYRGLVPIWHLRREVGEQVERGDFNEWLMMTQGEDLLYLQHGQAREVTADQTQDSISDDIRGLLFFASYPS